MLKKIIDRLLGKRAPRNDHTLYWTAADLEAGLKASPNIPRDPRDPLYVTDGKGPLWQGQNEMCFNLVSPAHLKQSIGIFGEMGSQTRESVLKYSLRALAAGKVATSDLPEALKKVSQMVEAHIEACTSERIAAAKANEINSDSAVTMAIVRMLELDKANLLEEQAMFTESEWKARAKAIDDGEINIETLRQNELEASVAVPYTGEEDLKGLSYDVLQEMLGDYRRKAMILGHMKSTYRHEDYTVFISKDGIQVEHENVVAFNGAA